MTAGYYAAIVEGGTRRSRTDSLKRQDAERLIRGPARLDGTVHDERPPMDLRLRASVYSWDELPAGQVVEVLQPYTETAELVVEEDTGASGAYYPRLPSTSPRRPAARRARLSGAVPGRRSCPGSWRSRRRGSRLGRAVRRSGRRSDGWPGRRGRAVRCAVAAAPGRQQRQGRADEDAPVQPAAERGEHARAHWPATVIEILPNGRARLRRA